jgi:hypothetical protein
MTPLIDATEWVKSGLGSGDTVKEKKGIHHYMQGPGIE